jgi:hypothetical protein
MGRAKDGEKGRTSWEEKALILGWIDERKEITRLGEWQGKRPGAGLVYVDVDVEISIDLVTGDLAPIVRRGK